MGIVEALTLLFDFILVIKPVWIVKNLLSVNVVLNNCTFISDHEDCESFTLIFLIPVSCREIGGRERMIFFFGCLVGGRKKEDDFKKNDRTHCIIIIFLPIFTGLSPYSFSISFEQNTFNLHFISHIYLFMPFYFHSYYFSSFYQSRQLLILV